MKIANERGSSVAEARGVVTGPDGLVEKDTKSHAARRIALDDTALAVLADPAAHMQANAAACRLTLDGNGFVSWSGSFRASPTNNEAGELGDHQRPIE